jgi:nitrite reductase/ring-hydroxylating ferredoxin subunit
MDAMAQDQDRPARNLLGAPVQRRTVIAAAAASGLLVACGTGSDPGSGADPSPADPSDGASGSGGSAAGTVLAAADEVAVGGGLVNSTARVVLTQPAEGQYKAFSAVCPHQGCLVSGVTDNVIVCGCHGSRFSAQTGDVERGPADEGLAEVAVALEGGNIVLG